MMREVGERLCKYGRIDGMDTITIRNHAITVSATDNKIILDTEDGAAVDRLRFINGGSPGQIICISPYSTIRDVIVEETKMDTGIAVLRGIIRRPVATTATINTVKTTDIINVRSGIGNILLKEGKDRRLTEDLRLELQDDGSWREVA